MNSLPKLLTLRGVTWISDKFIAFLQKGSIVNIVQSGVERYIKRNMKQALIFSMWSFISPSTPHYLPEHLLSIYSRKSKSFFHLISFLFSLRNTLIAFSKYNKTCMRASNLQQASLSPPHNSPSPRFIHLQEMKSPIQTPYFHIPFIIWIRLL